MDFAPRTDKKEIEQGLSFAPKFDEHGLIPVITVDAHSQHVLMMAYMNAETLRMTLEIGEAVYWSRSRKEIWHKGKTSGQIQRVVEMRTDCDQDAIVLKVEQQGGGCCHTGAPSCFYRRVPLGNELHAATGYHFPLQTA
jgi:phosphoribosyl-AMP cyclohydrolase